MGRFRVLIGVVFLVLLVSMVSADLCKGSNGYYHECGSNYNVDNLEKVVILEQESKWEDESDRYRQCLRDCDYRYRRCRGYSRYERCSLREECYDLCRESRSYSERVEYSESVQDLRDSYKESYEYSVEILDERDSLWREDRSEIIYLDKYEYEYERPYFSRDSVVVYINPYRYYKNGGQYVVYLDRDYDDVVYLDRDYDDVVYLDSNRGGYGYKRNYECLDSSCWRYKEPYVWSDYQDCWCEEWSRGRCQEWDCDDYSWNNYYYKPRQSYFSEGYNWRW